MQKLSKGSIDADRRLMAKARVCTKITGIEPGPNGEERQFDRTSYNDRQWFSLYCYCWQNKDDFEFTYKAGGERAVTDSQLKKLGLEIEDDDDIVRKNKTYTEDELRDPKTKIKDLRSICLAKGLPDDGDKKAMIAAILEVQELVKG